MKRLSRFSLFFLVSFICSIIVMLSCTTTHAQQIIFNSVPFNDALPSNETYQVFQDPKGYIWITTEQGLCRLDGQDVKVYNGKNGLPEKSIYAIKEHKGITWMITSNHRILTLRNGILKEHPISKVYKQLITYKDEFAYDILFSKEIIVNTKVGSYILDTLRNTVKRVPLAKKSSTLLVSDDGFLPINSFIHFMIKNITLTLDFLGRPKKAVELPYVGGWCYRFMTAKIDKTYFFAYNNILIKMNPDLSIESHYMPADISCIYVDKDKDLWVGLYKKGLLYYLQGKIKTPLMNLNNLSIGSVYQDNEKNVWCTTLERGVFMAKSKLIINYAEKLGNTYPQSVIKVFGNETYILKGSSLFAIDSNRNILRNQSPLNRVGNELTSMVHRNDPLFKKLDLGDLLHFKNNIFYTISYDNLHRIEGEKKTKYVPPSPGRCLAYLDSNTLLAGCNDGVYQFGVKDTLWNKVVATTNRVTKIFITTQKEFLIATKGSGLFSFRNGKLDPFILPAEIVYDIAEDSKGSLWFATNKGLMKKERSSKLTTYTVLNGLPTNAIAKLAINNQQLFLTTSAGLVSLPVSIDLQNKEKMPIYLRSASAGKTALHFNHAVQLKYNQNSILLQIDALSFKNSKGKLKYRLSPGSNIFRFTTSNQIILENLAPSSYTLTIYGMNSDGFLSNPLVLKFRIDSPFWQKWWFIVGAILLAIAILGGIVKIIVYRNSRKEEEKTRMNKLIAESRLSALQAQMNPHFVFNCINSIQNYILQKQEDKACDYLAQFSQLIRLVLHHSENRNINLAEELKLLALYISLEQLRFGDSFDYETIIDEKINLHQQYLPSMLIQPYLENAIWHGLMPLKGKRKGKLVLRIEQNESQLFIHIEDNGIGRKKSMEYKSADLHRPMALKLNQQRINTLNLMFRKEIFKIAFNDNYNHKDEAIGTTVTLNIPLGYE